MIPKRTLSPLCRWVIPAAVVWFLLPPLVVEARADEPVKPKIRKLGTVDLDMVEKTPVVFRDRLYRFEYVRPGYPANKTGDSYFRFIDVDSGKATTAFA